MAVATISNMATATNMTISANMATTASSSNLAKSSSGGGMTPALLTPEEEAATHRFLENVNKWRAANSLCQVGTVPYRT